MPTFAEPRKCVLQDFLKPLRWHQKVRLIDIVHSKVDKLDHDGLEGRRAARERIVGWKNI